MRLLTLIRGSRGFTVIEMVMSASIASIVMMLTMTVLLASAANYYRQTCAASADRSADLAMEYLSRDLRAAHALVSSYGSYSTSGSSIVMECPSYNSSGIIPDTYDYIAYSVDSSKRLVRTVVPGGGSRAAETKRVLARAISDLTFTYKCHDEFTSDGSASTYSISNAWSDTPTVYVGGAKITSGYTLSPSGLTITFTAAPISSSVIEVSYPVSVSNASALADVQTVDTTLTSQVSDGRNTKSASLSSTVRLRNRR